MSLTLPHTTAEPIFAPVRTGFPGEPDTDPTAYPVFTALLDVVTIPTPADAGWTAATWSSSPRFHYAAHPYGGDMPPGRYVLWVKIVVPGGINVIRESGEVDFA